MKQVHTKPLRTAALNIGNLTGRSRELPETLKSCHMGIACLQEMPAILGEGHTSLDCVMKNFYFCMVISKVMFVVPVRASAPRKSW